VIGQARSDNEPFRLPKPFRRSAILAAADNDSMSWLSRGRINTKETACLLIVRAAFNDVEKTMKDLASGEKTIMERSGSCMRELIHYIARSLVDDPDSVDVAEVEGNQTTVLELKVAKDDLGKIIGKQGRTAQAMRTILGAVSSKEKKRTVLEIIE
jgi:uncharacterized protein